MFLFRTFIAGLASNYHDYLLEFKDAPPTLQETKPIPLCTIPTLEIWLAPQFIWEDFLVV